MRPFSAETETVQVPAATSAVGTTMRSTLLAESRRQESLSPEHFPSLYVWGCETGRVEGGGYISEGCNLAGLQMITTLIIS